MKCVMHHIVEHSNRQCINKMVESFIKNFELQCYSYNDEIIKLRFRMSTKLFLASCLEGKLQVILF